MFKCAPFCHFDIAMGILGFHSTGTTRPVMTVKILAITVHSQKNYEIQCIFRISPNAYGNVITAKGALDHLNAQPQYLCNSIPWMRLPEQ
jgi:hypothetical protein